MAKGLRYSEEELRGILANNSGITISSSLGGDNEITSGAIIPKKANPAEIKINLGSKDQVKIASKKIILSAQTEPKKKGSTNINDINKSNKSAIVSVSVSDKHLAIALDGAKLLSINQIFAFLQNPKLKFSFFSYKKTWHDIIGEVLNNLYIEERLKGRELPFFNSSVELTIFRQAPKLVDEDALTTMFKFIIDALKRTPDNPHGILAEDNPKIVHKISCYSEKGSHCVGIKVKLIEGTKKEDYNSKKLLEF